MTYSWTVDINQGYILRCQLVGCQCLSPPFHASNTPLSVAIGFCTRHIKCILRQMLDWRTKNHIGHYRPYSCINTAAAELRRDQFDHPVRSFVVFEVLPDKYYWRGRMQWEKLLIATRMVKVHESMRTSCLRRFCVGVISLSLVVTLSIGIILLIKSEVGMRRKHVHSSSSNQPKLMVPRSCFKKKPFEHDATPAEYISTEGSAEFCACFACVSVSEKKMAPHCEGFGLV
jgi:hypothetical protein